MKLPIHWLHIGSDELSPQKFDSIINKPLSPKPDGGIWASPLHIGSSYKSDWHQFCVEVFGRIKNNKSVIFTLSKSSRFYVIHTHQDLVRLYEEVGEARNPMFEHLSMGRSYIDFEKAKEKYDVIYLTKQGQHETRNLFLNTAYNLYGWDCESCLILNPYVIKQQLSVSI